ncbi:hypothetical protein D9M69_399410 [compost metagenome]
MRNLKLVPKKPEPVSAEQLAGMLNSRMRVIDGEHWIPVRDLKEAVRQILGGEK